MDKINICKTINKVRNISWKFGVTAMNSNSDKVGKSFLQLKLCLNKCNRIKDHFIEMSIPEFYTFLHDLEKAELLI
ncbi:COMM domain-containing protein 7-like [Vespula squamosa]|uniref:COMM domain-containing protein 7-like n=1 Tax=Vespula squamosa TaxID=30214 RepID=A0ABD2ASE6_VESSQ